MLRRNVVLVPMSIAAWILIWAFWLGLTKDLHPTFTLALIVTTALVVAYASTAYVNHIILIPHYWRAGQRFRYTIRLLLLSLTMTGLALGIIRYQYFKQLGRDTDPYGAYKHFVIDFFGMAVHLSIAWIVVRVCSQVMTYFSAGEEVT